MTLLRALPLIAVLTLSLLTLSLSACSSSAPKRCQDCLTRVAPEGPLSAQTLSTKAQRLLNEGRAAQQRQDYTRAYDLHRQALWTLQARRRLFATSEDGQELELRQQLLPKLQLQATISTSVLGWASALIEQANSPYMVTTLRLDLIEAYTLIGEQQKVSQQLLQLNSSEVPHSYLTQRIEKAQRLAKTQRTSNKELVDALNLGMASAHLANPMMLRAPARHALTSLWPPQLFRRGALETWSENQRLRDLLAHGQSKDLALSVALYCHQSRDTCLSTFKQHAAKRKDDALMAQAQLLNLAFFYAEQDLSKRIVLMWSYYWLARERGEMALAGAWLEQQGLPLILSAPMNRRTHKQLIGAAERLFEHGQDATALKLLEPIERQPRQLTTTNEQIILAYIKHEDFERALRIFDSIAPTLQSPELLATLLERLAAKGDSSQLGRLDHVEAPTARYQALTKVATAFALQADTSTAKALLKQATNIKELPPDKLDHAYLDGKLHHLRALIALKDNKAAMSLVQAHLRALAREPTAATQLYHLAQLATTAGTLGQVAIFELALKAYIQQRSASPGTLTREDELIELFVVGKRYKLMSALINSYADIQQRSRALRWIINIVEKLHDEQQLIIEPAILEHLKEQVLELAKAQSVYGELARFSALSAKLKQPQLAADLARTLYSAATYQNKHQYSLKVVAGALINQGAPEQGMQLYNELKTDYERLELLRTLSQNIDQGPDKARTQRLLQDLIARTRALPKARQDAARAFVPLALANLNECERAVEALDPTIKVTHGTADDELNLAAKACLYAHKPAQALQLIEQIHLDTNKARALIQVGYYLDLSGQSRLPEVQAILKRAAKAL